ncbi:MAG: hypothetical protein ABSD71_04790 [Bacteroidales bacterium]|jgi:hypothetical protein
MKKIILLSSIAVMMIFFSFELSTTTVSAKARNNNGSFIHYQVIIYPDWRIDHNVCPLMVQMTNGSGMLIGQQQLYHKGTNVYNFYEAGPVTGVRKAQLTDEEERGLPDDVCIVISLSDSKSGTFNNGGNYVFNLYGFRIQQFVPNSPQGD